LTPALAAEHEHERRTMIGGQPHREVGNGPGRPSVLARRPLAGRGRIAAVVAVCVVGGVAALLALSLSSSSTRPSSSSSGPSIRLANSSLGEVLVDDRGRTLYLFAHDKPNSSSCA